MLLWLGDFFLPCLPNHWFSPLLHLTYCLVLLLYSSFQILYSSFLKRVIFITSVLFFMLLKFSLSFLSILIILTLYLVNCLPPLNLVLFLEISPVLSFWVCFCIFPFWLPFCVYFYILDRSAVTPSLCGVALCNRCPVGVSGAISLIIWAGCSRNVPYVGYMDHPVVTESWMLLAHLCLGSILRLANCEA